MNDFSVRNLLENIPCTDIYFAWNERKYMIDSCAMIFDDEAESKPWVRVLMKKDDVYYNIYEVSGPSYEYCADAFASARIFDGKCVWDVESELRFICSI